MRLSSLFFGIFIFCSLGLKGQSPKENHQKYWDYRDRFLEGFIQVGDQAGESIPLAARSPHWDCKNNYFITSARCHPTKGPGVLFWGDSTIELGDYIAVLSMMIRNLKDAKQPYDAEARELYLAIKAFERLDHNSETYFDQAPSTNGFFIRDDVPANFHVTSSGKKFPLEGKDGYSCLVSHGSCRLDDMLDGNVMSLDQVMNLFFGFTFVCEMIPEVEYNGELLSDFAALQVHRITLYLSDNNWKIICPNGKTPTKEWGGNTIAFSHAIATIANRVTKGKYKKNYHNKRSKNRGKIILNTFNWAHGVQTERNLWMAYSAIICSGKWNPKKMTKRALKGNREMYALAYCAINKQPLDAQINRKSLEQILNSAPKDGPCFETPNCQAEDGWKGQGRWLHTKGLNGNRHGLQQEYNGLDYMLFYNLYHYFYKDTLPLYQKPKPNQ